MKKHTADRPWNHYPLGTKAHSVTGGYWLHVREGWQWNGQHAVYPTPGGSACGECVEFPEVPASGKLNVLYVTQANLPALLELMKTAIECADKKEEYEVAQSLIGQLTGLVETPFIPDLIYEGMRRQYHEQKFPSYPCLDVPTPGWYFFYPKNEGVGVSPNFRYLDQDWLEYRDTNKAGFAKALAYQGEYVGPIPAEKMFLPKAYRKPNQDT